MATPVAATIAGVALTAGAVAGVPRGAPQGLGVALSGAGLLALAWAAGRVAGERRAAAARFTEEFAARAVAEEHLRIARELHDIVAHSLSLIAVEAGTADHVMAARPERARQALHVIAGTSRAALTEMRQLVGVLRSPDAGASTPAPGLGELPGLVERAGRAGVSVELTVHAAEGLPAGVAVSVYRIVQEALTNVIRHAAPTRCRVCVVARGDEVRVDVTDEGRGTSTPAPGHPAGHGLIGIRERALAFGGSFEAGPRPQGGFAVSARLPCRS